MIFEPTNSGAYRAARLAVLRNLMIRHIERTDAQAKNVEQALAVLAQANKASTQDTHQ